MPNSNTALLPFLCSIGISEKPLHSHVMRRETEKLPMSAAAEAYIVSHFIKGLQQHQAP